MSKKIDLTGQRFGFWIVKHAVDNVKNHKMQWLCVCECGQEKLVTTNSLRTGNSTSCGCNHNPNLIGIIFGDLTVISLDEFNDNTNKRFWICQCSCKKIKSVSTYQLRNKSITSCGCKVKENIERLINESKTISQNALELRYKQLELLKNNTKIVSEFNAELNKSLQIINDIQSKLKN